MGLEWTAQSLNGQSRGHFSVKISSFMPQWMIQSQGGLSKVMVGCPRSRWAVQGQGGMSKVRVGSPRLGWAVQDQGGQSSQNEHSRAKVYSLNEVRIVQVLGGVESPGPGWVIQGQNK